MFLGGSIESTTAHTKVLFLKNRQGTITQYTWGLFTRDNCTWGLLTRENYTSTIPYLISNTINPLI